MDVSVPQHGERRLLLSPALAMLYLVMMPLYTMLSLAHLAQPLWSATLFAIILLFAITLAHLVETRGLRRGTLMALSAFLITLGAELLGAASGLPFGRYHYTDQLGPKVLGLVPLVVPAAWLMMLYPAYETAALLAPLRLRGAGRALARMLIAAAAMTAWDISLDPRMVREGNWVWQNGGGWFGVPLSNYAGWLLTAGLIAALWGWIERREDQSSETRTGEWAALPVYIYAIIWLAESLANVMLWDSPLIGAAVFIGMGLFSLPALLLLRQRHVAIWLTASQAVRRWF
ncbi:MAG: carotenoid biosynthesis protein [Chloroflexi bacterium]|nr:carotenoid biosynthesis protein [Chloroflexota bacterium]MCL5274867.1 carotenoid biosynthesis protein [Chloroflexota bacterium]